MFFEERWDKEEVFEEILKARASEFATSSKILRIRYSKLQNLRERERSRSIYTSCLVP